MRWSFGVDGIAVPLVLLTALIGVLVAAHAWVDVPEGGTPATFLGCLLIVEEQDDWLGKKKNIVLIFS